MSVEPLIDHEARANAALALSKIEDHTKFCEDSTKRQEKSLDQMVRAIERLHGRIDKLLWGVVAALGVVIAQIILKKIGLL